jgi:hypothetical protein
MIPPLFAISLVEDAGAATTTLSIQTDTLSASAVAILAAEIQAALQRFNRNLTAGLIS